jgi:hypothetical protein
LNLARTIFGDIAKVVHPVNGTFDLGEANDLVNAIIGIISRHPMREDQLKKTLDGHVPGKVVETLEELQSSGRAKTVDRYGTKFWVAVPSYFPDELHGRKKAPE